MPTSKDRELTRDEALLALNDHLGDEVVVSIATDIGDYAPCVMSAQGVLSHWRASDERFVLEDTMDRDDITGLYDVGDASIDITELTTAYCCHRFLHGRTLSSGVSRSPSPARQTPVRARGSGQPQTETTASTAIASKGGVEKAASLRSPEARPAQPRRCQAPQRPSQRAQPRFSPTALCNSLLRKQRSWILSGRCPRSPRAPTW